MGRLRRIAIELFLMVGIAALLALAAPFGSAAIPPGPRFLHWVGFIVAGWLIFSPVAAVGRWASEETRLPRWVAVALTAIVASLPLTAALAYTLGGFRVTDSWFGDRFMILYLQVVAVGIGIHLVMLLVFGERAATSQPEAEPKVQEAPPDRSNDAPFLRRLPPELGRELSCLEMQDHYVRARTRLGSTLLLMRFRDAVAELDGRGMQVHRSWWAAYDAMESLDRDGRAAVLRLKGGESVPVSRAFLPAVRSALGGRGFDRPEEPSKSRPVVAEGEMRR